MAQSNVVHEPSGTTESRKCAKCGADMRIAGLVADAPGVEQRIYRCDHCGQRETQLSKLEDEDSDI